MLRFKDTKYLISSSGLIVNENTGKSLAHASNGRGYLKVSLTINGQQIQRYVHRLVAELYVINPDGHKQVNHKDGDKSNNHFSNLEWVTPLGNVRHAISSGLFPKTTDYWSSKLSELDIMEILRLKREGWKQYVIAKRFSVSKCTVSQICTGKRHKALTGQELKLMGGFAKMKKYK